ncbi:manganese ABC transporter substrate-binding lipoprotein [Ligilactobacillus pabuli]|uniref:Manganese ABC transporter substrate-binding lipoprotein n=1 Tax=Ligilactobacillus pabuli TaxID=2886039 RepID=A0ABQ5JJN0_9LACO|nr:metal ABC transporter substrate-binding protein [Ligilactobacillus pabuli]GKS82250.1 manganese ABC transporter substrate-binding lipoprotein [Ligilactobacillus pabuli]HIW89668.1 metal ABC transporter substrate-binding protein [Candidatus Ligilactobacillus excrementipullorum]
MKRLKNSAIIWWTLVALVTVLVGCGTKQGDSNSQPDGRIKVVATNSIIADIVQNIGKDRIALHSIVPVGQDPHEYEPLAEDVRQTERADVIFYNGINLETGGNAWFTKLVKNAHQKKNRDYFAVSDGVDVIYLQGQGDEDQQDPHAWLDLQNGMIYAKNIEKRLAQKDPANREFYHKNLTKYLAKLTKLDKQAQAKFTEIPAEKKLLVTSEGAFKYFSRAYDLPSTYLWEINTEEEGTPDQSIRLIRKLRKTKTPTLFVESSVDDRPMKTVAQDTRIPVAKSKLFTDSIANQGEHGDSYYSMMKWNLDKIAAGLAK